MSVSYQKTTDDLLKQVADNMRPADVAEIKAAAGVEPFRGLTEAVSVSQFASVMMFNDEPVAVFGLARDTALSPLGMPWLLGTGAIEKNPLTYLKAMKDVLAEMLRITPELFNLVHAENIVSVRFLRSLGFKIHDAIPHGVSGEFFHPFTMGSDD